MLDYILQRDRELLIFLNNLGSEQWDGFWLFITSQFNWAPLFAFILYLVFKNFGLKKGVYLLLFIVVLVAFSDQFTNLIKRLVGRVRPCNVEDLQQYLRQFVYRPKGGSFWSGHACLSMTFTVFVISLLKEKYKYIYGLLLFPLVFGYSRIYLRVHYPLDVLTGYAVGVIMGGVLFCLSVILYSKLFKEKLEVK